MLTKRKLTKGKVKVTFSMPPLAGVAQLYLVGDFNNWSVTETPLTQAPDGSWDVTLTLDGGQRYHYRYLSNGETWHNDWAADAYEANEYGSENSVVDLTDDTPAPKKKAAVDLTDDAPPAAAPKKKAAPRKKKTA